MRSPEVGICFGEHFFATKPLQERHSKRDGARKNHLAQDPAALPFVFPPLRLIRRGISQCCLTRLARIAESLALIALR
jgi:hypothetical protein